MMMMMMMLKNLLLMPTFLFYLRVRLLLIPTRLVKVWKVRAVVGMPLKQMEPQFQHPTLLIMLEVIVFSLLKIMVDSLLILQHLDIGNPILH